MTEAPAGTDPIDDRGTVWMTYLDPAWLPARHGLTGPLAAPLVAPAALTARMMD